MKKINYLLLLIMTLTIALSSCKKTDVKPLKQDNITTSNNSTEGLWMTPNGKIIPYSEKENWQSYEKKHFIESREKADIARDRIMSFFCTTEKGERGTYCKVVRTNEIENCTKVYSCTWCGNCITTKNNNSSTPDLTIKTTTTTSVSNY